MSPRTPSPLAADTLLPTAPISGVTLDGNSISIAEVALGVGGKIQVSFAQEVEANELLEKVGYFRHPIHQSVNHLSFPVHEKLSTQLGNLVDQCKASDKCLVTLPEDIIHRWAETLNGTPEPAVYRRGVKKVLHPNPYGYPMLLEYNRQPFKGKTELKLWSMRFDDFMQLAELFLPLNTHFSGAVTGHRALRELIPRILTEKKNQPQIVVHLGKLRTTYLGIINGEVEFAHTIPVGVSRDGSFYFEKLSPNLKKIGDLINDLGTLILPADTTPTRIFNKDLLSPQSEATRFAHQVGEYSTKIRKDYFAEYETNEIHFYLSGTVCRLKGLMEFLIERTGLQFDFLKNALNDQIECPNSLSGCITDHLKSIGTCLSYHAREANRTGMILTDQRPKSLKSISLGSEQIATDALHLIEYPQDTIGGFTPTLRH